MWPFKNKIVIKETKHHYPYGRHNRNASNHSVWDNLSGIEKLCMVFLPVMLGFIFYMMCDMIIVDLKWYYRLIISSGGVALCIGFIVGLVNFFSDRY